MTLRKMLTCAFALAAVAALTGSAIAAASPAHRGHHATGRITAISSTSLTVGTRTFSATARQLAGLSAGQCVEVESKIRHGVAQVSRIGLEDRCTPVAPATSTTTTAPTTTTDDPAQHDVGDDHGVDTIDDDHGHLGGGDEHHGSDD